MYEYEQYGNELVILKGKWKPKIILSLYESDLIIETCEPILSYVFFYKAVK